MRLGEHEGVVVYDPSNMFYLSGYTGEGLVLVARGISAIITDFRYTEQAQAQAQTIVDNAVADANSVRQGSIQYTDDMLKSLQTIMNHTMEGAQGRFDAFMNSMKSSYDIVSSNRKELSSGIITEKEESAEPEKQDSTEA